jgi:REP element-mobilizing transposase RayT
MQNFSSHYHVVARSQFGHPVFKNHAVAISLWSKLSSTFDHISAACLMPNHVHVLVKALNADQLRIQFKEVLRGIQISNRMGSSVFEPVPMPILIPDAKHLFRQVRYVHLNPCRAGLVKDPLSWMFSTHRDALGLSIYPLPGVSTMMKDLGFIGAKGLTRFHEIVSADPTCSVEGTLDVQNIQTTSMPEIGITTLKNAVRACLKKPVVGRGQNSTQSTLSSSVEKWSSTEKDYLYALLMDQGHTQVRILLDSLQVTRAGLHHLRQRSQSPLPALKVLRHYAADARLRTSWQ